MSSTPEPHDPDSCPFGHIDGICAGEALGIDPWATGGIYDKMVHRNPDGSDPLVPEPKGKP
jgi:hypothetical protein